MGPTSKDKIIADAIAEIFHAPIKANPSPYGELSEAVNRNLGSLTQSHPITALVCEPFIRIKLSRRRDLVERNRAALLKKKRFRKMVGNLLLKRKVNNHAAYLDSLRLFPPVSRALYNHVATSSTRPIFTYWQKRIHRFEWLSSVLPVNQILMTANFRDAINSLDSNVEMCLGDLWKFDDLEEELNHKLNELSRHLVARRIRFILSAGDTKPGSRFLQLAVLQAQIPSFSILHGWVAAPDLAGMFPTLTDKSLAWSQKQVVYLNRQLKGTNKSSVEYHGVPRKLDVPNSLVSQKNLLLLAPSSPKLLGEYAYREAFQKVISILRKGGIDFRVRMHPHDRCFKNKRLIKKAFGLDIKFSEEAPEKAIEKARFIAGTRSTMLIEAKIFGRSVAQIFELSESSMENVRIIHISELSSWVGAQSYSDFPHNTDDLLEHNLDKIVPQLTNRA